MEVLSAAPVSRLCGGGSWKEIGILFNLGASSQVLNSPTKKSARSASLKALVKKAKQSAKGLGPRREKKIGRFAHCLKHGASSDRKRSPLERVRRGYSAKFLMTQPDRDSKDIRIVCP